MKLQELFDKLTKYNHAPGAEVEVRHPEEGSTFPIETVSMDPDGTLIILLEG